jgi:prepilin-type N-terminal cleavage/methylation domain-containing protein
MIGHRKHRNAGFTLIELMIVVAIIAIIAAIAVPNLLSARLAANESNAIATLRNVVSAQAQFQQSAAIDADGDGTGEYGYFGDLAGLYTLDSHSAGGAANPNTLNPPVLAASFRTIDVNGIVNKGGYMFRIYLPDAAGAGIAEDGTSANGGQPLVAADANNCELAWSMYAWPANYGSTGNRAFFVNQQGEIMFTLQQVGAAAGTPYSGTVTTPIPTAALIAAGANGMLDRPTPGAAAQDGEIWVTLQ